MRAALSAVLLLVSMAARAELPGWRGVDHFGIAVPDIEVATEFLVEVIGCEHIISAGPFGGADGPMADWLEGQLGVDRRANIKELRMLRCRVGSNIELFEWNAPDEVQRYPKLSDYGGNHIAFYVDDLTAAIDYLRSKGVQIVGGPLAIEQGDMAGDTIIYVKTPWGGYIELVSYPGGMGYEKDTDRRLWHPARPGE